MNEEIQIDIDENAVILDAEEHSFIANNQIIYYREGVWCEPDENGELIPDWNLTWFYTNPKHPEKYLYFEQDPPETAICNLIKSLPEPATERLHEMVFEIA